jgi:hypothetical protein
MSKILTQKLYLKQNNIWAKKMQEGVDLAGYINVFNQVVTDLVKVDVELDDEDKAIILMCSFVEFLWTLGYNADIWQM